MGYFLAIGFLLGVRHAFDGDHLAAVTTLVLGHPTNRESLRIGVAWGLGHALMLFVATALVMATTDGVSEHFAAAFEMLVGVMLVLLGTDVIRRALSSRLHGHGHAHDDDVYHYHFHAHSAEVDHDKDPHRHRHAPPSVLRACVVGVVHGLAGSAALILLTIGSAPTWSTALIYVALFGLGSVLGMGAVSLALAVPFRLCAANYPRRLQFLNAGAGLTSVILGAWVLLGPLWSGIVGTAV